MNVLAGDPQIRAWLQIDLWWCAPLGPLQKPTLRQCRHWNEERRVLYVDWNALLTTCEHAVGLIHKLRTIGIFLKKNPIIRLQSCAKLLRMNACFPLTTGLLVRALKRLVLTPFKILSKWCKAENEVVQESSGICKPHLTQKKTRQIGNALTRFMFSDELFGTPPAGP